ncbi:MAG: aldehyde ferredoxin oxidoreductase family protein [Candidatus Hodarchaeaceae archaeon]|nr:aldehyde ferredoxin oxidoreductase family protein [Candidatus Hodarchaeaceae archaeon]
MALRYSGYVGKYLRVDLTSGKISEVHLEEQLTRLYLGGNGFGTKILWDEVPVGVDPFDPENRLIFSTGPLTGTVWPTAGRLEVIGKSPLTGIYGDANAGGHFAPELKFAGYDMIVFQGKSKKPVYLWVEDGRAELRDASHLWGKGTWEAERTIRKDHGDGGIKVAGIGQAGENRVRFAGIITSGRAAARTGLGAVMGSKNLKCVAARGTFDVGVAKDEFYDYAYEIHQQILANEYTPSTSRYGTLGLVNPMNEISRFPTKNFQRGDFPYANEISGEILEKKFLVRRVGCYACPISCGRTVAVRDGPYKGTYTEGVEYETINALGARTWNRDMASILKGDLLCDEYGIDSISTGGVIAFAMECFENGIISEGDTDGLKLEWGNPEIVLELIEKIAKREGIGNVLAEGVVRAAKKFGKGAEYYAMHIKGMEMSAQDPRSQQSYILAHITGTRGADHLKGFPCIDETGYVDAAVRRYGEQYLPEIVDGLSTKYKPMVVKDGEELGAVADSAIVCKFGTHFPPAYYWPELARGISLATGMQLGIAELKEIGERIYNLQRCFNVREGIGRRDDTQPRRILVESGTGRAKGHAAGPLQELMLDEYYELRRWDKKTGWPTRAKLEELGLKNVAEDMEKMGRLPARGKRRR